MTKNQKGFTLVEIAIVLVIIGLIIGSILKGQELVKSAKVKRVWKQSEEIRAAVYGYQDRYKNLPGDDSLAATHVGGVNGDGNGIIESGGATNESMHMFDQLEAAGFIAGSFNGTQYGTHALGGSYYINYYDGTGNPTKADHWVAFATIPGEIAEFIDTTYDDGSWNTGGVQTSADYNTTSPVTLFIQF